jgi:hypothetical protein
MGLAMARTVASPRPVPCFLVVKYGSKILSRSSAGIPWPVSATRSSSRSRTRWAAHGQGAALRHGLDGVQKQVQQGLQHAVGIKKRRFKFRDPGLHGDAFAAAIAFDQFQGMRNKPLGTAVGARRSSEGRVSSRSSDTTRFRRSTSPIMTSASSRSCEPGSNFARNRWQSP